MNILTLKQALKHGLKLKKVHRAISFYQRHWLKAYIDKTQNQGSKLKMSLKKTSLSL